MCVRKKSISCDDTEIRTHAPTSDGFEITTDSPGQPERCGTESVGSDIYVCAPVLVIARVHLLAYVCPRTQ